MRLDHKAMIVSSTRPTNSDYLSLVDSDSKFIRETKRGRSSYVLHVFFDGKRLKSTLLKMPGPIRVVVSMPTHDMGVCQPSKEVRERIVIRWANHKMPVVGHQTVAQKWQRKLGVSFDEYSFKRLVVLKFFKQHQLCHGSVEHMETSSARTYPGATRHTGGIKTFSRDVKLMSCVPFLLSRRDYSD